ncbi:MAG TPA: YtxH domain-containing protein [Chryseolinea sp.]|nr:YtxH domain-containing protein [Chryseolinea sp.]
METKTFTGGFLAGALLGVAVGILLANSTSGETKEKLVKGAKKITDSLGETVNDAVSGLKEQYIDGIERAAERGKETIKTYSGQAKA